MLPQPLSQWYITCHWWLGQNKTKHCNYITVSWLASRSNTSSRSERKLWLWKTCLWVPGQLQQQWRVRGWCISILHRCRVCDQKNNIQLLRHVQRHNPDVPITWTRKKQTRDKLLNPAAFKLLLEAKAEHFQTITEATGIYIWHITKVGGTVKLLLLFYLLRIFNFIA